LRRINESYFAMECPFEVPVSYGDKISKVVAKEKISSLWGIEY
jgi:hypothetical protein